MFTTQGYFKIDLCNLMTRIDGTAEKFSDTVLDMTMHLSKKLIALEAKDCQDGSTFKFIKTLETDGEWLLRVTMLSTAGDPTYSLRFRDMKVVKHDVALGDTISQTLISGSGVIYDHSHVKHTIHLSFGSYEIED